MSDRLNEFGDNVEVALITFTSATALARYAKANDLPFPVLLDSDRSVYRSYGLGRGSIGRVYGWKTLKRYVEILREHGFDSLRRSDEDTLQLGGDFIVSPTGDLIYGFWGEGPAERPSVDELIAAVQKH